MALDPALCRMPDGRWSCVREGVTEPCGDCDGCRLIYAERRAFMAEMLRAVDEAEDSEEGQEGSNAK